jgi:microcompartment protein CcmK/EutM
MFGHSTGMANTSGSNNTYLGYEAGYSNANGSDNTIIGYYAGGASTTGSGNVFIGKYACTGDNGSNKLCIANSITTTPLIYGDFSSNTLTVNGSLGIGTKTPARQLHLVGSNAVFRMDRTADTAAFMLVRTDTSGNPQKTFVVGANSSGSGVGTFVINDLGTAVSGGGTNRMTINNDGSVTFTGNVYANSFVPSSMAYKDNIRTYENALDTVNKLRGVRFDWKDSGKPSVGLIAEEVEKAVPEVVAHNDGNATGVNYASLVGVLVEAVKEQQGLIKALQQKNEKLEQRLILLEGK